MTRGLEMLQALAPIAEAFATLWTLKAVCTATDTSITPLLHYHGRLCLLDWNLDRHQRCDIVVTCTSVHKIRLIRLLLVK